MDRLKKFASLEFDKRNGSGTMKIYSQQLMNEPTIVLLETFNRFTEIQHISMNNCYIDDEMSAILCNSLKSMRHLKTLDWMDNSLSRTSIGEIIRTFSKAARKLETLDLRNNNTTYEDGEALYQGFSDIRALNGIQIRDIKSITDVGDVNLKDMHIKACEVAILCLAIRDARHIRRIDISDNNIDARGAEYLARQIPRLTHLSSIDISNNPITNEDKNFAGIEALMVSLRNSNHVCHLNLDRCGTFPPRTHAKIIHSLHVNRCVNAPLSGTAFEDFVYETVKSTAPPVRTNPLQNWIPSFTIDREFAEKNKLDERTVEVKGDEIIIGTRKRFF
jgi:Leucine-rich repeat (LRR) protein